MELSQSDIAEILQVFADSSIRDLHLEVGSMRLHVSKDAGSTAQSGLPRPVVRNDESVAAIPEAETVGREATASRDTGDSGSVQGTKKPDQHVDESLVAVRSPVIGVFYRRPAPDQPPYVEVGDVVTNQTPVCTLEVMKMFTEIPAGVSGTIVEICIENEELVEYDQILMFVRPT